MSRGADDVSFTANLLSGSFYKRNQGRLVRRLTGIAIAAVALFGAWTLSVWIETNATLSAAPRSVQMGLPIAVGLLGLWLAFRIVHYPRFANFLISVEAEMDKVSWADADYLKRATAVVLCTMVFLGTILWVYDFFWFRLFSLIHILDADALSGAESPPTE
jgi:preprotein translocase subunit SecE